MLTQWLMYSTKGEKYGEIGKNWTWFYFTTKFSLTHIQMTSPKVQHHLDSQTGKKSQKLCQKPVLLSHLNKKGISAKIFKKWKLFLFWNLTFQFWNKKVCIIILMAVDFPFSIYFLDETFFVTIFYVLGMVIGFTNIIISCSTLA